MIGTCYFRNQIYIDPPEQMTIFHSSPFLLKYRYTLDQPHQVALWTSYHTYFLAVEENKFLGIVFDRKLSFIPHIKQLKAKCQKALNLLRVVAHTDWGADRKVLLNLYRTIIRSKLDYGSIIYGSARKSYLEMLDPIHHQGLRLALGAFRTSPSESLLAEANEPSLYNRRLKLSMQYALTLKSNRGWSGGAMVLGKLPVPGRPTILITVGQGSIALAVGAGGGGLDIFTLIYHFSSFFLSLGDGSI